MMKNSFMDWINIVFDKIGGDSSWIIQVFIVVFATSLINYLLGRFLRNIHSRAEKTQMDWDDALVSAARRPLAFAVWVVGLAFAAKIIHTETGAAIFGAVDAIRDVGFIFAIAWFLNRFVRYGEKSFVKTKGKKGEEVDEHTIAAIGKLLRLSIIITTSLVMLQTLGFNIAGVLAFGGIGGIAIGFAAKDLLANFFGGLMIYLDRPFTIGDWVRSPDRNIEGTVENIGWRLTRIRTFDKRPIYVPNSVFASIVVENPSRMSHRRIYETIGIRYDDISAMTVIVDDVKAMLKKHDEIDTSQTMIINFNSFSASSCDFFVYTFTKTTDWIKYHKIKQDVLLKISDIISWHNAEMAFPTSTIHLSEAALTEHASLIEP